MTVKKLIGGIAALMLIAGIFLTGCGTVPDRSTRKVAWAAYTPTQKDYDYTIVGVIILKDTDTKTLNADLMDEAIKLGGHDVINVRVDLDYTKKDEPKILAVTALAIKYSNVVPEEEPAQQ